MIIIYRKSDDIFMQAVPGYPKTEEIGNKLLINDIVAINDLTVAGYIKIPDQPVNVPQFYDPTMEDFVDIPTPYTALGLNLTFAYNDLPCSIHVATVVGINPGDLKPAVVRRHFDFDGIDYDIPAYVTETVKDQWLAGDIAIGDYIIVIYCEERMDDALVIAKVFKSWP